MEILPLPLQFQWCKWGMIYNIKEINLLNFFIFLKLFFFLNCQHLTHASTKKLKSSLGRPMKWHATKNCNISDSPNTNKKLRSLQLKIFMLKLCIALYLDGNSCSYYLSDCFNTNKFYFYLIYSIHFAYRPLHI